MNSACVVRLILTAIAYTISAHFINGTVVPAYRALLTGRIDRTAVTHNNDDVCVRACVPLVCAVLA